MKMKQCGFSSGNSHFSGNKRTPLNTIVLPPLHAETTQLLFVNKTKVGVNEELLSVSRSQENNKNIIERSAESIRIAQLEQNIKFLRDQHQTLLNDLHNEIEILRNKNRDLQFQLLIDKNQPTTPETSTSSSDDEHKISSSPHQNPFTSSLHVELLEKMIGDLKLQLQENEGKNVRLSSIIDEQKKKLANYDKEREKNGQIEPDLRRKIEEADTIIRRLQQENNSLRDNVASPSHYHQKGDNGAKHLSKEHAQNSHHHHHYREHGVGYHQNGSFQKNGRGNRRNNSSNSAKGNWFPPLQTQNYWQNGGGGTNRNGGAVDKNSSDSTLPNLRGNSTHHYHHERRNNNYNGGDGGSRQFQNRNFNS